jgi:hypothetical protein
MLTTLLLGFLIAAPTGRDPDTSTVEIYGVVLDDLASRYTEKTVILNDVVADPVCQFRPCLDSGPTRLRSGVVGALRSSQKIADSCHVSQGICAKDSSGKPADSVIDATVQLSPVAPCGSNCALVDAVTTTRIQGTTRGIWRCYRLEYDAGSWMIRDSEEISSAIIG